MRTTVTLDQDLAAKLRKVARERGISFKATINDAIRQGLSNGAPTARPYRMPTAPLGVRPGVNLDKALALAGELEDAEIIRKLELGK
jgi:Ribbon-helix-helix protein, copG family